MTSRRTFINGRTIVAAILGERTEQLHEGQLRPPTLAGRADLAGRLPPGRRQALGHVIVTLGTYPWCSSNWQTIYYRIWETKASAPAKLLLNEDELGFIDEPIEAAVQPDDVLVEYTVEARDGWRRRQIRHYHVAPGKIERVDPVALSPRDFV